MKLLMTALVLGFAAGTALAADDSTGWNAGASAVFGEYDFDNNQIDDKSTGFKLFTGYRINKWLGLEGSYHNFGRFKEDLPAPDGDVQVDIDGFSVTGLLFAPLSKDFEAFAKAGWYTFDQQAIVDDTVTSRNSPDGLTLGAGARAYLSDRFAVRADADWFDIDDADLWSINLGIEYLFGKPARPAPVVAAVAAPPPPPPPAPPPPPPAPKDSDHDGVMDNNDKCPGTPAGATVDADGCEVQLVLKGVLFSTNSATLTASDQSILDSVAKTLAERTGYTVAVVGHTDNTGSDAYNQSLSQRRADAVRDYLVSQGIPAGSLSAVGMGESEPIATNDTADGRAENRRVTLDFSKR
ncbi:MAG: hypothetical protein DYH20_14465 [Gammaproteobacteria bacterium PRO9]|nr:hypothetical protein [Gammaproteobacteria bacterium PRO9]